MGGCGCARRPSSTSDAEVAEIVFTAFTSKPKAELVSARLIVRRVPDRNPAHQSELFTVYRYHTVFTNSPLPRIVAESAHRAHAIVEQVIADLRNGPLAHLPSGHFWANSAWLVCAAMAFNASTVTTTTPIGATVSSSRAWRTRLSTSRRSPAGAATRMSESPRD